MGGTNRCCGSPRGVLTLPGVSGKRAERLGGIHQDLDTRSAGRGGGRRVTEAWGKVRPSGVNFRRLGPRPGCPAAANHGCCCSAWSRNFPGTSLVKCLLHPHWVDVHMSDKHRNRYVAFEVTYVILFGMLKVTYPSAACPISPVQTESGQVSRIRSRSWQKGTLEILQRLSNPLASKRIGRRESCPKKTLA